MINIFFKSLIYTQFFIFLFNSWAKVVDYDDLQKKGYNKSYLDQNLNSMLSMPFFLFIMTSLASILTMNTLKRSNNFTFLIVGLIACVAIYYFKDL